MFALKSGQGRKGGAARPALLRHVLFASSISCCRAGCAGRRAWSRASAAANTARRASPASIATAVLLVVERRSTAPISAARCPTVVQAVTARTGFAVDQVRVVGHRETSEIDILERLDLDGWTSLIGFDADAARQRIAELPWVKVASVRKVYPDTLEVRIEERKPFAIWQHGSQLTVVERSGKVIAPFTGGRHAVLPLVIGYGAAEHARRLHRQDQAVSRTRLAGEGLHPGRRTALGSAARKRHHHQAAGERRGRGDRRSAEAGSRGRAVVARHRLGRPAAGRPAGRRS